MGAERNSLLIDAGDGRVTFNANIGQTQRLGTFTIDRAQDGVVFGASDKLTTDPTTTGNNTFVTNVSTDGAINIGSGTNADNVIGGVGIVLNGVTNIAFQTSDDDLRFNGKVWLQSNATLDTDEGASGTPTTGKGNVLFTSGSTLNSQNGTIERDSITFEGFRFSRRWKLHLSLKIDPRRSHAILAICHEMKWLSV